MPVVADDAYAPREVVHELRSEARCKYGDATTAAAFAALKKKLNIVVEEVEARA